MPEQTILQIHDQMQTGNLTSRQLIEYYLERIKSFDSDGPCLNSIIELNPDAIAIADALDAERSAKGSRGLMHGIPVVLKDNIDTADKMMTTAGSLALIGSIPSRDAFLVERLRSAGAVILAKTNLSEWANFRSMKASSGWSSRGGQTLNPYALDRNPCGSSSGSAVAVAADLCSVSVGTETDGSVICPSNANGIVGIKPTVGLVSRSGIIPISHTQDTAGPMGRCVADAAILLGAMIGTDSKNSVTNESVGKTHSNYSKFLDLKGLNGARIGVVRNLLGFDKRVDEIMRTCIEVMEKNGAKIIDPANISTAKELWEPEFEVLKYEFKANLNEYLVRLGPESRVKSLADVIQFNKDNHERVMPFFGQDIFLDSQEKGPLDSPEYIELFEKCQRLARTEGLDPVMDDNKLDALIAPSGGPAWLTDHVTGDHFSGGSSSLAAVSGYPSISAPAGYIHGLPIGISFISRVYQEPLLISLAYSFEQAMLVRKPPMFKATVEI